MNAAPAGWSHSDGGPHRHGIGRGFVNSAILSTGRLPRGVKAYKVSTGGITAYVQAESVDQAQRIVELVLAPACSAWTVQAMEDTPAAPDNLTRPNTLRASGL